MSCVQKKRVFLPGYRHSVKGRTRKLLQNSSLKKYAQNPEPFQGQNGSKRVPGFCFCMISLRKLLLHFYFATAPLDLFLNFIASQEISATFKQHICDMQFNVVAVALKS